MGQWQLKPQKPHKSVVLSFIIAKLEKKLKRKIPTIHH